LSRQNIPKSTVLSHTRRLFVNDVKQEHVFLFPILPTKHVQSCQLCPPKSVFLLFVFPLKHMLFQVSFSRQNIPKSTVLPHTRRLFVNDVKQQHVFLFSILPINFVFSFTFRFSTFFCCVPLSNIVFSYTFCFSTFIFLLRSAFQHCIFVYIPLLTFCFLVYVPFPTFIFLLRSAFQHCIFVYVPFFNLYFFCCVPLFKFAILFPFHLKHRLFGIQCSMIHMRRCLVSLA